MRALVHKYRLILGFLIVLIVAVATLWTHSNPYLLGGVFVLGIATGALVVHNNPDLIERFERRA